jgi:alpha-tubulin suppressor-like RCC1 family protein
LTFTTLVVVASGGVAQDSLRAWGMSGFDSEGRRGPIVRVCADEGQMGVLRADGRVFTNGQNHVGILLVPQPPPGITYIDLAVSSFAGAALRSDGNIDVWGQVSFQFGLPASLQPAPPLPAGISYTSVSVGGHGLALRSDGTMVAWGNNQYGQSTVPSVPPGRTVVRLRAGKRTSYALLSDGSLIAWGDNSFGQLGVPALPVGISYLDVQEGHDHVIAIRSDGDCVAWGDNTFGQCNVPPRPAGTTYLAFAAGGTFSHAYRSDGVIVGWGDDHLGALATIPLVPPGQNVVQMESNNYCTIALLSNGEVMVWGAPSEALDLGPTL